MGKTRIAVVAAIVGGLVGGAGGALATNNKQVVRVTDTKPALVRGCHTEDACRVVYHDGFLNGSYSIFRVPTDR